MVWGADGLGVFGAFGFDDPDDLGNDFACFFDLHGIANVEVPCTDHAIVVEGGVGDGCAGEFDGFEGCSWGDLAGFADLVLDAEECGGFAFGGELVGDDPSWGFAGVSELFLLGEGIDSDDDAVGGVVEGMADLVDVFDGFEDAVDGVMGGAVFAGVEAECFCFLGELGVSFGEVWGRFVDSDFA